MKIDINLIGKRFGVPYRLTDFVKPDAYAVETLLDQIGDPDVADEENVLKCFRWVVEEVVYPWRNLPSKLSFLMLFADLHILFRHPVRPRLTISPFEHWKFPEETITEKVGDCEDTAIALCSLLRNFEEDVWVVVGFVDVGGIKAGHAWVQYKDYLFETTLDQLPANPWQKVDNYYEKTYFPTYKFNDEEAIELVQRKQFRGKRLQTFKAIKKLWENSE